MKLVLKIILLIFPFLIYSQHSTKMIVRVNIEDHTLLINQTLTYNNTSNDTLQHIILNDWNNAFSSKSSALAKRFSDEFIRAFHLATDKERGYTNITTIVDENYQNIYWERPNDKVDLVKINLNQPLLPCSKKTFTLVYVVKIPDSKFTKYGFDSNGRITLKDWFLNPSKYEYKQDNRNPDKGQNRKGQNHHCCGAQAGW